MYRNHYLQAYNSTGDSQAHAKFQDLSKAYNVLSDDAARARYDELGESGLSEQAAPQFDAMLFFRRVPLSLQNCYIMLLY
jgi:DnaJ-class molecular chaperone